MGDAGAAALFGSGAAPRKLRPSSNGITTVPATVRGLARLEELHLYHNKLVSVDGAIVALEGMLRRIDLDGNGDTLLQPPAVYARNYDGGDSSDSEDGGDSSPAPPRSRRWRAPSTRPLLALGALSLPGQSATSVAAAVRRKVGHSDVRIACDKPNLILLVFYLFYVLYIICALSEVRSLLLEANSHGRRLAPTTAAQILAPHRRL